VVWFKWTAPGSGTATVNTLGSGYDTVLTVYDGRTEVDCNDDAQGGTQSIVVFNAVEGTTYYFEVAAYDGNDPGTAQLEVTLS
jgi:pre-peptidase